MRRAWIRGLVSLLCGFVLVGALYRLQSELSLRASSSLLVAVSDALWTVLDWPPAVFFNWVPHERGMGPGIAVFLGPIITNIVVASILFYAGLTLWTRRKPRLTSKA
jgi:hypothetical protein